MKRHPRIAGGIGIMVLLLMVLVPVAMAQPGHGGNNGNGFCPVRNPHCPYPPSPSSTQSPSGVVAGGGAGPTTTSPGPGNALCKDGSSPPCVEAQSFATDANSGLPVGAAFAGVGVLILVYLAIQ